MYCRDRAAFPCYLSLLWFIIRRVSDGSFRCSHPSPRVIHLLGQSCPSPKSLRRAAYKNCLSFSSIRKSLVLPGTLSMDTLVSSKPRTAPPSGLTLWLHEREITLLGGGTLSGRHLPERRCLRKIWAKSLAALQFLPWTVWATARGSRTVSPRGVGGRGGRAGRAERTRTARPLGGNEGRSPAAAAARSPSRISSRSASWPTWGSARGPSPWTRRSRRCVKSSPRCPRTSSVKYRRWNSLPDTSTSFTRCCRATSWTPRCQAAAMWRTRGWATPSRCGGWRAPGPCQHLTSIWRKTVPPEDGTNDFV